MKERSAFDVSIVAGLHVLANGSFRLSASVAASTSPTAVQEGMRRQFRFLTHGIRTTLLVDEVIFPFRSLDLAMISLHVVIKTLGVCVSEPAVRRACFTSKYFRRRREL